MNPVTDRVEAPHTRPLRADAVRNQQRILVAARELFADHGLDVTLDLVAEHAGVGVGTVYRRFANKQELIAAVFADSVELLAEQARFALTNPDPWDGLVHFFEFACEHMATNRGLSEVVRLADGAEGRMACVKEKLEPAAHEVVARAEAAGALREGIEGSDFFAMINMVDAVAVFAAPVHPTVWRRYFDIMLDGMRADSRPRQPITVAPMTTEQVDEAKMQCMERGR